MIVTYITMQKNGCRWRFFLIAFIFSISIPYRVFAVSPTLTTQVVSAISPTGATLNGTITSTGSSTPSMRGFVYGTTTNYGATTTDTGITQTGAGKRNWSAFDASPDGTKIIAGATTSDYVYTSSDGGVTWVKRTSVGEASWTSVGISSDGTKMIVTNGRDIYISVDSGVTWTAKTSAGKHSFASVAVSPDGNIFVTANHDGQNYSGTVLGTIYTSIDGGTTWVEQTGAGTGYWASLRFSPDSTKLIVGGGSYYAYVYNEQYNYMWVGATTDAGVTWGWTRQTSAGQHNFLSVAFFSNDGNKRASVDRNTGAIYTSIDSGITWASSTPLGYGSDWTGIAASFDGASLAVVSNNGYLYKGTTSDGGATWVWVQSYYSANHKKLVRLSPDGNRVFVAAQYADFYISPTPSPLPISTGAFMADISGLTCGTTYYVAAYATNTDGTAYAPAATFTTSACSTSSVRGLIVTPVTTDLRQNMIDEIDGRITGFATTTNFNNLWTRRGNATDGWQYNTSNFWANEGTNSLDFTGASPLNTNLDYRSYGTLISPRHVLFANHFGTPNGGMLTFVDKDNNVFVRTIVNSMLVSGSGDIRIAVLNADVPSSIAYYPLLNYNDVPKYLSNGGAGIPMVRLDQAGKTYIQDISGISAPNVAFSRSSGIRAPYSSNGAVGGDSGSPNFFIIGGTPVLAFAAWYPNSGPNAGGYITQINAAIDALGGSGGYYATTIDLTHFSNYATLTFPISQSFTIPENTTVGSAVGTVSVTGAATPFIFTVLSGNTNSAFTINNTTGAITVNNAEALDFDTTPTYSLVVQVKNSWSPVTTATTTVTIDLSKVSGYTSPNNGTVSTSGMWTKRITSTSINASFVTSSSDGTKLAMAQLIGSLYTSSDSGATWVEQTSAGSYVVWQALAYSPDGSHLYATDSNFIYVSMNDGATWATSTSAGGAGLYLNSISSTNSSGTSLVAIDNATNNLITSADSGATWTDRPAQGGLLWATLDSSADGVKLIAADGAITGDLYTSTDSGLTWIQRTTSGNFWNAVVVSSADGEKFAAIGNDGYLYTSSNGGVTWMARTTAGARSWNSLVSSADGTKLYAADGTTRYIYASTDSGTTWVAQTDSGPHDWTFLASSADGTMLAAVSEVGAYTSTDSGARWTRRYVPGSMNGRQITSSADGAKLASLAYTDNGTLNIRTSTDSGATWTTRADAGTKQWSSIASSADGTKLAASVGSVDSNAYTGYIYTSTDSGSTWATSTASGVRQWTSITSSSDGTKLAATVENGYIYTSTDSGLTWATSTASGIHRWVSITSSSDGTRLVAIESSTLLNAMRGYLYTSTDSGATWTARTSLGQRYWTSVTSSADGTRLAAATTNFVFDLGYIYTSVDGGATWIERSNLGAQYWKSITSSADGTKLAVVNNGGYIYLSADGGATWTSQTTSPGSSYWHSIASSADGTKLVANAQGSYTYTYLSATVAPPTLAIPSIVSVTTDGAALSASIIESGASAATVRGFVYGTGTHYGATTTENGVFGPSLFNATLNGLNTCTTYHYTDYAKNSVGFSYGTDQSFTTTGCLNLSASSGGGSGGTVIPATPRLQTIYPDGRIVYLDTATTTANPAFSTITNASAANLNTNSLVTVAYKNEERVSKNSLFTRDLTLGAEGSDVLALQKFLNTNGYVLATDGPGSTGKETMYFGNATRRALIRFQTARGISPARGYFGDVSREHIRSLNIENTTTDPDFASSPASALFIRDLTLGAEGSDVLALQKFLNTNGYAVATDGPGSTGKETMYFGNATRRALIRFQTARGISPARGYFGQITRNTILQGY